jgi:hypothetical protein
MIRGKHNSNFDVISSIFNIKKKEIKILYRIRNLRLNKSRGRGIYIPQNVKNKGGKDISSAHVFNFVVKIFCMQINLYISAFKYQY